MVEFLEFLITYGYVVLFVWIVLDQAGLPLPALPLMLAAGALVGGGQLSFGLVILVSVLASVPIDMFWYFLGKSQGGKVLNLLCTISLEPDFCVRNTEATFDRLGPFSLLIAKFVPGLQTLAPPMAGLTGMSLGQFLILDTIGALVWSCSFVLLGFAFHNQLEALAMAAADFGLAAGIGVGVIIAAYIGGKLVQRRVFLRTLEMRRLLPAQVNEMLSNKEPVHVIDLRHSSDFDQLPETVPNAVRVPMEAIDRHAHRIPKDSDIIVYCS